MPRNTIIETNIPITERARIRKTRMNAKSDFLTSLVPIRPMKNMLIIRAAVVNFILPLVGSHFLTIRSHFCFVRILTGFYQDLAGSPEAPSALFSRNQPGLNLHPTRVHIDKCRNA